MAVELITQEKVEWLFLFKIWFCVAKQQVTNMVLTHKIEFEKNEMRFVPTFTPLKWEF